MKNERTSTGSSPQDIVVELNFDESIVESTGVNTEDPLLRPSLDLVSLDSNFDNSRGSEEITIDTIERSNARGTHSTQTPHDTQMIAEFNYRSTGLSLALEHKEDAEYDIGLPSNKAEGVERNELKKDLQIDYHV